MKISFDIGIEDSMAFYRHFFDTDPNVRKQWRQPYFIGPALFTILGLVLTMSGMWFPLIVSSVAAIGWLLIREHRANRGTAAPAAAVEQK